MVKLLQGHVLGGAQRGDGGKPRRTHAAALESERHHWRRVSLIRNIPVDRDTGVPSHLVQQLLAGPVRAVQLFVSQPAQHDPGGVFPVHHGVLNGPGRMKALKRFGSVSAGAPSVSIFSNPWAGPLALTKSQVLFKTKAG